MATKKQRLLFYFIFVNALLRFKPSITRNITLHNLYDRQMLLIDKKIEALHEDLQYDYREDMQRLK